MFVLALIVFVCLIVDNSHALDVGEIWYQFHSYNDLNLWPQLLAKSQSLESAYELTNTRPTMIKIDAHLLQDEDGCKTQKNATLIDGGCFLLNHDSLSPTKRQYNDLFQVLDFIQQPDYAHYFQTPAAKAIAICVKLDGTNACGNNSMIALMDEFYKRATALDNTYTVEWVLDGAANPNSFSAEDNEGCLANKWRPWNATFTGSPSQAKTSNNRKDCTDRFQLLDLNVGNAASRLIWQDYARKNYYKFSESSYPYYVWEPEGQEAILGVIHTYVTGQASHHPGVRFAINQDPMVFLTYSDYKGWPVSGRSFNKYVDATNSVQTILSLTKPISSDALAFVAAYKNTDTDTALGVIYRDTSDMLQWRPSSTNVTTALGYAEGVLTSVSTCGEANIIVAMDSTTAVHTLQVSSSDDNTIKNISAPQVLFHVGSDTIVTSSMCALNNAQQRLLLVALADTAFMNTTAFLFDADAGKWQQASTILAQPVEALLPSSAKLNAVSLSCASQNSTLTSAIIALGYDTSDGVPEVSIAGDINVTLTSSSQVMLDPHWWKPGGNWITGTNPSASLTDELDLIVTVENGVCFNNEVTNKQSYPPTCDQPLSSTAGVLNYFTGSLKDWQANSDILNSCNTRICAGMFDAGHASTTTALVQGKVPWFANVHQSAKSDQTSTCGKALVYDDGSTLVIDKLPAPIIG